MNEHSTPITTLAWIYAAIFVGVVVLGYLPGVTDEEGLMFGLFRIDPIDDAIHLASGLWAAFAAWRSTRQATFFFRAFGVIYFLDGLLGAIVGKGFLDGAILLDPSPAADVGTRIAANVPHLALGGLAILLGFVMARRWARR